VSQSSPPRASRPPHGRPLRRLVVAHRHHLLPHQQRRATPRPRTRRRPHYFATFTPSWACRDRPPPPILRWHTANWPKNIIRTPIPDGIPRGNSRRLVVRTNYYSTSRNAKSTILHCRPPRMVVDGRRRSILCMGIPLLLLLLLLLTLLLLQPWVEVGATMVVIIMQQQLDVHSSGHRRWIFVSHMYRHHRRIRPSITRPLLPILTTIVVNDRHLPRVVCRRQQERMLTMQVIKRLRHVQQG
jgi:hypothetical protein